MKRNNKVIPIFGNEELEEDKKMDDKMKKEFFEGADKEEERLLNDPALKDITAPDDMFGKIMGELRAQGKLRAEDMVRETERPEIQNAVDGLSEEDREALLLGRMLKARGASADDVQRAFGNPLDECNGDGRKRENGRKNRKRSIGGRGGRLKVIARNLAIGAAGFAIIVGGSMTTSAGREYVFNVVAEITESIIGGGLIIKEYNEDEEPVTYEQLAYEDVLKKIGVNPLNFIYLPEELDFLDYEIQEDNNTAIITYGDDENMMIVTAEKMIDVMNNFATIDGVKIKKVDSIRNDLTMTVYELNNSNGNSKTYASYFTYESNIYIITSNCDIETFALILEKLEIKIG